MSRFQPRNWWERDEYAETRGDYAADPDFADQAGSDVAGDGIALGEMQRTKIGEPPSDYDVRSIFDSRPVNGYDFTFSGVAQFQGPQAPSFLGVEWILDFTVPSGYRIVPRTWEIEIENAIIEDPAQLNMTVQIRQQGGGLANNGNISDNTDSMPGIVCGYGTEVETFFVCEENTSFGIQGTVTGATSAPLSGGSMFAFVTVHGNLIPVSEVALPYCIANRKQS